MDKLIEKIILRRNTVIIKQFFDLVEFIFCKIVRFCNLENKLLGFFQIFTNGKLISAFRRKKYTILKNRSNSKIINEVISNSFCFLGKLKKDEIETGKNYFLNQK